uniref:Nickel insertion protein n=1 Tax=Peronospora matthiolae TaxID=2874970 RepID=A0AAV1UXJ6_9STRA
MALAYVDCSAGIAGDMLLGALIDAGASLAEIKRGLESLHGIKGEWQLSTAKVWKGPGNIAATKVHVSSIYQHKEVAPPSPVEDLQQGYGRGYARTHSHGHGGTHSHDHGGTYSHGHEGMHDHEHEDLNVDGAGTATGVENLHDHSHDHDHDHALDGHEQSIAAAHDREPVRNLDDIKALIAESDLSDWVKAKSVAVFTLLAQAEAHTHGTALEKIHFHEVGAIDSIVDTIGSVIALDLFGVREVHASFVPFSSGTVKCMHGILPVPPPATFRLMIGVPVCPAPKGANGELVTPTGISLVKALASTFGEPPAFIPTHTGVGAGTKEFPEHANIVRVAIGTKIDPLALEKSYVNPAIATSRSAQPAIRSCDTEKVVVLETNLDDLNPQVIGYVSERLLSEHHALDVWKQPIQMKKNRLGVCLSVLCRAEHEHEILEILFRETSTLGVRRNVMERFFLPRNFVSVLAFGRSVDVKVAFLGGQAVNVHPEFEHCKAIALEQNIPLLQVMDQVKALAFSTIRTHLPS